MKLRIGSAWAQSAINLTESASGAIVGKLDSDIHKSETKRISSEIPDPTFGYLRGSSMGRRAKGDALRNNLIDADMGNLSYVDYYGGMVERDGFSAWGIPTHVSEAYATHEGM